MVCIYEWKLQKVHLMPAKTHGLSYKHPLWSTWKSMRTRCNNPNATSYNNYGARGIKVCERWGSFKKFIDDVGEKPSAKHQLDRISSDGDYEPNNIRWSTREQQNVNQRPKGKSKVKGVYWYPKINKWVATSCKYHGRKYLGTFDTIPEAKKAITEIGCTYNEEQ